MTCLKEKLNMMCLRESGKVNKTYDSIAKYDIVMNYMMDPEIEKVNISRDV